MESSALIDLIPNLGFPIVCVIALAGFSLYLVKTNREENKAAMDKYEERSQEREDKLYNELAECRVINNKAIETIATYAEKLDVIQKDVSCIKTDITIIKSKD